jgi:bifunctional DNA-binding transcriptional regulator/antitoxin component of YhaV-PrlF toxin-antitoxin module
MVIPTSLRKRFGIQDGSFIIAEEREDGILIRPAVAVPVEVYTPARQAEFILSNVVDVADYSRALEAVRKLGVEPESVPHQKPDGI